MSILALIDRCTNTLALLRDAERRDDAAARLREAKRLTANLEALARAVRG